MSLKGAKQTLHDEGVCMITTFETNSNNFIRDLQYAYTNNLVDEEYIKEILVKVYSYFWQGEILIEQVNYMLEKIKDENSVSLEAIVLDNNVEDLGGEEND